MVSVELTTKSETVPVPWGRRVVAPPTPVIRAFILACSYDVNNVLSHTIWWEHPLSTTRDVNSRTDTVSENSGICALMMELIWSAALTEAVRAAVAAGGAGDEGAVGTRLREVGAGGIASVGGKSSSREPCCGLKMVSSSAICWS